MNRKTSLIPSKQNGTENMFSILKAKYMYILRLHFNLLQCMQEIKVAERKMECKEIGKNVFYSTHTDN